MNPAYVCRWITTNAATHAATFLAGKEAGMKQETCCLFAFLEMPEMSVCVGSYKKQKESVPEREVFHRKWQ